MTDREPTGAEIDARRWHDQEPYPHELMDYGNQRRNIVFIILSYIISFILGIIFGKFLYG